jgi:FtsP/CotA-like multicopper oxidase with cupredoxin domain
MTDRRNFIKGVGVAAAMGAGFVSRSALAALPESPSSSATTWEVPPEPTTGPWFKPVVTLNSWSLPWRMKNGWKEFHLTAEAVEREMAPGMVTRLWGYNGQSPGPTIECVEGDKVRIFVTNRLPEHTTIHWHGIFLPAGMDGVGGLNQPQIPPGKTYAYEFQLNQSGTFMYHPHADEMVQMAMGMMGSLVVHPRDPTQHRVDRDYCFLMAGYDIEPGTMTARINTMLDFNIWSWNSRVFPGIDHLVSRLGERVRVRMGNLTMTNHPIHIHGLNFEVSCTDGGWVPKQARWPEVTVDIAIGQMRAVEFIADAPGDWAMHCHKSHHTMNPMGHDVPNMIGVDQSRVHKSLGNLLPGYMIMGERGMADMGEMIMPLPQNTLPMMTGEGPFGPIEMGGMFTVLKIRADQKPDDYSDPGWYQYPEGTVSYEV